MVSLIEPSDQVLGMKKPKQAEQVLSQVSSGAATLLPSHMRHAS